MRTLVVYFTKFGNTRRVAEAIAEAMGRKTDAESRDARTIPFDELTTADLEGVEVVVMGSPTHIQNVPGEVRSVLKKLPRDILAGKSVAAFDTSLKMWGPLMRMTAAHRLAAIVRRLGGRRVVGPETFFVKAGDVQEDGEVDLLCDGEIARAKEWATSILNQIEAG